MKKLILISVAALALAGCNLTQSDIDTAKEAYRAAFLVPAAKYRGLGLCPTVGVSTRPCADRAIVAKLRSENASVNAAFVSVQAQYAAGSGAGAQAAFGLLQIAVTEAEATAATLGVH